jgi:hypothetical protein
MEIVFPKLKTEIRRVGSVKVDGTGSRSCSMAGFDINVVVPSGPATTILVKGNICRWES